MQTKKNASKTVIRQVLWQIPHMDLIRFVVTDERHEIDSAPFAARSLAVM